MKKYDITFITTCPGNSDQDQCIEGYFTGKTDNILEYYEHEYDMEHDGMDLLKNLIEINRL